MANPADELCTDLVSPLTDSYVSLATYRAYILQYHGVSLPAGGPDQDSMDAADARDRQHLRLAMSINDWSWDWKGERIDLSTGPFEDRFGNMTHGPKQRAFWPRHLGTIPFDTRGSYREGFVDGIYVDPDGVPENIQYAQMEMAYLLFQEVEVTPVIEQGTLRSQRLSAGPVGVMNRYAKIFETPKATRINMLIGPYHNGPSVGLSGNKEMVRG